MANIDIPINQLHELEKQFEASITKALTAGKGSGPFVPQRNNQTGRIDNVVIIEIPELLLDKNNRPLSIYDRTRSAKVMNSDRARQLDHVLALYNGVIVADFVPIKWNNQRVAVSDRKLVVSPKKKSYRIVAIPPRPIDNRHEFIPKSIKGEQGSPYVGMTFNNDCRSTIRYFDADNNYGGLITPASHP